MENTSANELAHALLDHCLAGTPWPESLIDRLIEPSASRALFSIVVERLADLFEPRLCAVYAELFAEVIARTMPELHAPHLTARYARVSRPRTFDREPGEVRHVFVLSRVTLGADVAVTSVILDAVKRLFPEAEIYFAGTQKGWELFAGDARIKHLPVAYRRGGTFAERLSAWPDLRSALSLSHSIVIDPDSRLTQLGLLPVCPEEDYYFFESRSFGGDGADSLSDLTKKWVHETFGISGSRAYLQPDEQISRGLDITVSLGVGENPAKRLPDPFEEDLLRLLSKHGRILIDRGVGGEEAGRVDRAVQAVGGNIDTWDGSFAGFAARIAASKLYVGYDSAGGHVAAATGVPMIGIFAGAVSPRMLQRWTPSGPGRVDLIPVEQPDVHAVLDRVRAILENHRFSQTRI